MSSYVGKFDEFQRHSNLIIAPVERLYFMVAPWPFYKWQIDIWGSFMISMGQFKFMVVAIEYFTKWVEAEPLTTIRTEKIFRFI